MIGVFDSGIGGLTVMSEIHRRLPSVPMVYLGDQGFAPYGDRSASELTDRCNAVVRWLIEQGCQLIVIACNTATAVAIDQLRAEFKVPIVGVEPGVKPAAMSSKTRCVGVLATANTLQTDRMASLIERFVPNGRVLSQACVGLADAIESDRQQAGELLKTYLSPLLNESIDHLVLGCTHYPLLWRELSEQLPKTVTLVDTAPAIAAEVERRYPKLARQSDQKNEIRWCTTGDAKAVQASAAQYSELDWLNAIGAPSKVTI